MPKLRKQSVQQRRQSIRQALHNYREQNQATYRLVDSQNLADRRQNPEYRENERTRNRISHQTRRRNVIRAEPEQERNTLEHSLRRQDPNNRESEQERNTLEHSLRRQDPNNRESEQERNTLEHSLRRQDPNNRESEQERNTLEHSLRRLDPIYRAPEQERDELAHSLRRLEPHYRAPEQERDALAHSLRRQDLNYRESEQERDTRQHSLRRSNRIQHITEQQRNTTQRRETRQDARIRRHDEDRVRNCRVRSHRVDPINRENVNNRQSERNIHNRQNLSPESRSQLLALDAERHTTRMLSDFYSSIRNGPTEICICCGGLWFPNQIKTLDMRTVLGKYTNLSEVFFLSSVFPSEINKYKFCNTCHKIVNGGKVPTICLSNGLHFPCIPEELKGLTSLEERFVAPRIPFMRIVSLGYNRQCGIRGAVVNVPISLNSTVSILPRTFDQTEVIQVHLKRRLQYNHSFMTETIRPLKIVGAARHLIGTELYIKHNITISENWLNSIGTSEEVPFISSREDREFVTGLINDNSEEDTVNEFNPQETLLENNPIENIPLQNISVAPGEGQRPLDLLLDEDSEELSYPSIYCGVKRTTDATIAKVIKSEARRYDRRCARVDKILYSYKKLELSRIKGSISTCLRKKFGHSSYTARDILDDSFVQNLIQHDEGYHVLKGIRSSPAHWQAEKNKVLAMIRQFGLPTFFITLSAAESQWPELLVILAKVVEDKSISEEEALAYTTQQKYELIRMDPITCSRYFDQRIRHLFKHFKASGGIFDEFHVQRFYWRIEFQQRGSPHVHGIYWLNNAPIIDISDHNSFPPVINFIDKFISTDSTVTQVQNCISYQKHNHSRTCQREIRGHKFCRFRIPYPPLPRSEILLPLPENIDIVELKRHKENYEKINSLLNAKLSDHEVAGLDIFEDFLSDPRISMTQTEYSFAIRSSLKKPQIFLRRTFKDRSINAFNPKILSMQRANMDIQFVLDAYACVAYIVNYINKSNRGVSKLLQEAMNEIRAGNFTVKQRLQHIGNKFISASEVSAQEASYNILGMHLSQCSSSEVYINTFVPEKRVRMVKSKQELRNLPTDSTDIFQSNLLDHYIQRPDILDNVCLAYFAAYYSYSRTLRRTTRHQREEDDDFAEDDETGQDQVGTPHRLKNNSGFVYKRNNGAIIRFPSFKVDVNRGDYFRGLTMLYFPWRSEREDLLVNDNENTCNVHTDVIEMNRLQFEMFKEGELQEILQAIQEESSETTPNQDDNTAVTQLLDDEFRALAVPEIDANLNIFDIEGGQHNEGNDTNDGVRLIRLPVLISSDDLLTSVRTLNVKQRAYLQHLLQNVVHNIGFCEFIGGGAGVGKSRLIKTIYQSITYRFNSIPGANPDSPKVLLSAPTGKAAFGIGGATLHSLFSLPVNQYSGELRPLSSDNVNSLIAKFIDLKLIIVDEISMVGARMQGYLDSRLKQIFKSTEAFGGISILVFGDFKQLPPVGDRWIFSANTANPYGVIVGEGLWDLFSFYELTEIMRQRDDQNFAISLNRMATGEMTEDDIQLVSSRIVSSNADVPLEAIHLFWSNNEAGQYNSLRLAQISTEEFTSKAFDLIKSDSLSADHRIRVLNSVANFKTSETQGLCSELKLKSSAKYMMTVNINTSDGLVNGATGVLMSVETQNRSRNPITLWMLFSDENVGRETRTQKSHATQSLWTPIEKCMRTFQFKRNEQINIERCQFPLVVAEGITIHKSQGATYAKVAVHIRSRMNRAALYVACSRATKSSGLFIIGSFNPPKSIPDSDPVKMELRKLRTTKELRLQHNFMLTDEFQIKLFYQNVQSLRAHHPDISSDSTLTNSDLLCLVETWTFPEEHHAISDFSVLSRLNCCNDDQGEDRLRNKRGIIIFVKSSKHQDAEFIFQRDHSSGDKTLQIIVVRFKTVYFMILYRNSSFPERLFNTFLSQTINDLQQMLQNSEQVIIMGDFNICRSSVDSRLETILEQNGFSSLLERTIPTTKHGTHIDWSFTNNSRNDVVCETYATAHSHHDGIVLGIK